MKFHSLVLPVSASLWLASCSSPTPTTSPKAVFEATESSVLIGGQKVVILSRAQAADIEKPQLIGAEILPGRGMNIYQLKAFVPGKGIVNVISTPPLEEAAKLMNGSAGDEYGNQGFKIGGGILFPFANRITGKLSADKKTLVTKINGKNVTLEANWKGKEPKAIEHAMHGLILGRAVDSFSTSATADEATVTAKLSAGDFNGHWLSKTDVSFKTTLNKDAFIFTVTATNAGTNDLPVGFAWHPYFNLPSGDRTQARLHIPAKTRAIVNNYDDVFPTGKVVPLAGTPYDFSAAGGAALNKLFMDDCFLDVRKDAQGRLISEIIDPAAKYGVRIKAVSPEVSAVQVYAPPDKAFVVFEPQTNYADPYNPAWKDRKTGMKVLKPGESVSYTIEVELFVP
jgi:aldose 1-epimerase